MWEKIVLKTTMMLIVTQSTVEDQTHVMSYVLNCAKARIEMVHTNIQERFPSGLGSRQPPSSSVYCEMRSRLCNTWLTIQDQTATCYTTFQNNQLLLLLLMHTFILFVMLLFLNNDQSGINILWD
jgi:hypothetical protein